MKRKAIADIDAEDDIALFLSIVIIDIVLNKALFFFSS